MIEGFWDEDAAWRRGDYETIFALLGPLAKRGYADAQSKIGLLYDTGKGVPQNCAEAARWYRLAAEQGVASAQYNLALKYFDGQGVPQDYVEAMKWFRQAAEKGFAKAQSGLGFMYERALGVPTDYVQALTWYSLSASSGNELAASNRDNLSKIMTPGQIKRAEAMARKCQRSGFKNFD